MRSRSACRRRHRSRSRRLDVSGAELVLGPLLRYAGTESATFWVETSAPCEVEILGHRTRTFAVEGHHYALLLVDDLEPASVAYDVRLDGGLVWPPDDGRPQPVVHTRNHERQVRLVFGSCRVGGPQPTELTAQWPEELKALGIDALWTYSKLQRGEPEWPDGVLLLGDQVYADEVSPETLEFIRSRRSTEAARRADRRLRGVLAALPRVVVGARHPLAALDRADDDDLRRPRRDRRLEHLLAAGWRRCGRRQWWEERITGAFMAYWIYQHIGNLSPPELEAERTLTWSRRGARRRSAAARARARVGSRVGGEPLGLLPRLRRLAAARARLARGARAGRGAAGDGRRGGVGLDRRALARGVRPSRDREHAAGLPAERHPPPRGVERGALRRALGRSSRS